MGEEEKTKLDLYSPQPLLTVGTDVGENADTFEEVIEDLPQQYKNKVCVLLWKMSQNTDVSSWDTRGAFLYQRVPVPQRHLLDLVKAITQTHTASSAPLPKDMDVFMTALAKLNVRSLTSRTVAARIMLEDLKPPHTTVVKRIPVISLKNQKVSPIIIPSKRKKQRLSK